MPHDHPSLHHHSHGDASPHPAQRPPLSLLRMSMAARVFAATGLSGVLWLAVLLVVR